MPDLNLYAVVILVALLADYCVERTADVLNLRALCREPPAGLGDLYEQKDYRRSQAYTRARTRLGIVSSTTGLLVLLGFWFLGGFDALDLWLRQLDPAAALGPMGESGPLARMEPVEEWGPVGRGVLYLGALGLGWSLLSLPFSAYSTFVIEERFEFNRTTFRTFLLDLVKGLALGIAVGGPLLAAILWLFSRLDRSAWLVCWIVAAGYTLLVQWVAPRWLMPLFNEFEPLEEGELRDIVTDYVRSEGYDLEQLSVMDASRRSTKANAFFVGFGRTKRLTLFDTIVEKLEKDEVLAVVAHEMGHYKRGHIVRRIGLALAHQGAVLFLLSVFLEQPGLYDAFYMTHRPIYAGLLFFGLLMTPLERLLALGVNALHRRWELEADRYAVETTGDPESLVSGLKKLAADHLANLTPHRLQVLLRHSHPPLRARLEHLESLTGPRPHGS
ncbi:MAG: M48 family metallopeptidase [Thermoanaerobaculia bacterium]|nr:M48 family metallopeptidase [Thermoanaerobaculia bacterium]